MTEDQAIKQISQLLGKADDEDITLKEISDGIKSLPDDAEVEVTSDYGIHQQLNDAVWQAVPNREYAILNNFTVSNPANTWQLPYSVTIVCPQTLKGIVQAVKDAEQKGWKIRGLASLHSFSQAPLTPQCYVYLTDDKLITSVMGCRGENFESPALTLLKNTLVPAGTAPRYSFKKADLFEVAGGCTINEINDRLCPYDADLSEIKKVRRLLNMGGGDVQTFAGGFATGTHGTGGKHSAYHDMVKSVVLVCTGGRVYRVEPTKGITDPAKHDAYYAANPGLVKPELLQDDEKFYSLLVSFGSFGIVHSAIIEVTQMDLLHEDLVYKRSGFNAELKQKMATNKILPDFTDTRTDFFQSILVNPYKLRGNAHNSVTVKTVTVSTNSTISRREDRRNFWPTFMTGRRFTANIIRGIANGPGNKRRMVETALKNLNDNQQSRGGGYTDFSYRVWNSGAGVTKSMGCGVEFAFKTKQIPAVMEKVFALLDAEYKPLRPKNKMYLNSPISLRFVRNSEAYLAPNYKTDGQGNEQEEWCYIELLRINSKRQADNQTEIAIFSKLQNLLQREGGRPHWGLNIGFPFNSDFLEGHYPQLPKWVKAFNYFNPTGLFDNALTDSCGFRHLIV